MYKFHSMVQACTLNVRFSKKESFAGTGIWTHDILTIDYWQRHTQKPTGPKQDIWEKMKDGFVSQL